MKPTLPYVEELARSAGQILRDTFGTPQEVNFKGEIDLVTAADLRTEAFLLDAIQAEFPDHRVIAEESGVRDGDSDHAWFIDPLDGTTNYAHGVPIYCVSIAYAVKGVVQLAVVYNPQMGESYTAGRGQGAWLNGTRLRVSAATGLDKALLVTGFPYDVRVNPANNLDRFGKFMRLSQGVRRLGSAALDLCFVAAGRFDGYWEIRLKPWDIAAGGLVVQEAGGVVTNLAGDPNYLSPPYSILAANPFIHPQMLSNF